VRRGIDPVKVPVTSTGLVWSRQRDHPRDQPGRNRPRGRGSRQTIWKQSAADDARQTVVAAVNGGRERIGQMLARLLGVIGEALDTRVIRAGKDGERADLGPDPDARSARGSRIPAHYSPLVVRSPSGEPSLSTPRFTVARPPISPEAGPPLLALAAIGVQRPAGDGGVSGQRPCSL
jgi:hypothetical protein